jgi:hypothetical protein
MATETLAPAVGVVMFADAVGSVVRSRLTPVTNLFR